MKTMLATRHDAVDDALARTVVYRFLSVGFQPPTGEGLRQVAGGGFAAVIAALRHLDRQAGGPLAAVAARLATLPPPTVEGVSESFVRLFGHTARGLVCACETEYGADNTFHQPQQLADLAGYYLAFGLRPVTASDVRVDHIACECEFMDFLNRKEALLVADDDRGPAEQETLEVTTRAARDFLRDHLARFGRAFATRLASEDPDGYFGALGHVLLAFLNAECERLRIDPRPAELVLRPEMADDAPMACGSADELIQIQRRP
jgi:TorA maturation chaperone TorD